MSDDSTHIQQIEIEQLEPNPLQPRGVIHTESLQELSDSIRRYGVIEPLVIAHTPAGYQIVAGERRWRAAKLAGLPTVPVVIKETTPMGMLEMAIIENVQRVDLNPMDRAKAFERLQSEFKLTTTDISDRVGKSASYVSNSLRLLRLPDALTDGLLSGSISEGHARALSAIEDTRLMIEAYKEILRTNGSVRMAEELSRRAKTSSGQPLSRNPGHRPFFVSQEIDEWTKKLQTYFGEQSKIKLTRSARETKIVIALKGKPEETQTRLEALLRLAQDETFAV